MKIRRFDILFLLLVLLLAVLPTSCSSSDEDVEPDSETVNEIEFDFTISIRSRVISRADHIGSGEPEGLKLWVYGDNGEKPLLYMSHDKINWTRQTPAGDEKIVFTASLPAAVEVEKELQDLRVYAVINSDAAKYLNIELDDKISEAQLKDVQFNNIDQTLPDNRQLMFGTTTIGNLTMFNYHPVSIEAKRCVSKLELFFTQQDAGMKVKVNSIMLKNLPSHRSLLPPTNLQYDDSGEPVDQLISQKDISTVLNKTVIGSEKEPEISEFADIYDQNNTTFAPLTISNPYIFEQTSAYTELAAATGGDAAYLLEINYTCTSIIDGQTSVDVTKTMALPAIPRNTLYRIFLRVTKGERVEVNTITIPWTPGKGMTELDVTYNMETLENVTLI